MPARDGSRSGSFDATPIRWLAGDGSLQTALDGYFAALEPGATLQENARRTLRAVVLRGRGEPGRTAGPDDDSEAGDAARPLVLKTHHLATGRHRLREAVKRRLGRSPARREWRALVALHAAGVPVPRPLAYGRLAIGDELVVFEFVEGMPLRERFAEADAATRDRLVENLSATLARLHASGHVHGDLHLENLRARSGTDEIVLLDLQRLRRSASQADRLRDFASLELSLLRAQWPAAARGALRTQLSARAPGAREPRADFDSPLFDTALQRFAADHVRGRARRRRRPGRGLEHVRGRGRGRVGRLFGLRDEAVAEADLLDLLERAERSPGRRERRGGEAWIAEAEIGARTVVVKWRAAGGLGRRLLARIRGTSAARAFDRGLREQLLLARSARAIAYLEQRRAGLPGASWLVLERVGDVDLDAYRPTGPVEAGALARELADWLVDLHAVGQGHNDLKGSNLRLRAAACEAQPAQFWLVDLEDLRGPEALGDEARLKALTELNASIPDAHFDPHARLELLARYLARRPLADFSDGKRGIERASAEIARRSLARAHRWRGERCAAAQSVVTVSQRK